MFDIFVFIAKKLTKPKKRSSCANKNELELEIQEFIDQLECKSQSSQNDQKDEFENQFLRKQTENWNNFATEMTNTSQKHVLGTGVNELECKM